MSLTAILGQVIVNWMMISLTYCLLTLGLTLIYSVMGVLNFTHGAIYMLGGYVTYIFVVKLGLPYPFGLVFAFVLIGLLGVLMYKGLLGHFRMNTLVCLIITFGLTNIFENGAYIIFSPYEKAVPSLTSVSVRGPLGVSMSIERLIVMICGLALMTALLFFIGRIKMGRAMRAVANDSDGAMLQGINVEKMYILGMFIACGLAGIAGGLMAPIFGVGPFIGSDMVLNSFIVLILGGMGSISGAIVGSFVLGLVTSFGHTFLSGDIATMISFALLILILVVRPKGLLGGV